VTGKSKVELEYFEATRVRFGSVASGRTLRNPAFRRRLTWTPDILIDPDGAAPTVVEYDGAYFHGDKLELDSDKSLDLLAAGYRVVRLREHPLPLLHIEAEYYTEFVVYSTATRPATILDKIAAWIGTGAPEQV